MRNSRRRWSGRGSWPRAFGQDVHLDSCFFVAHLRPPPRLTRENLKSGYSSYLKQFINPRRGKNDIKVLRNAADISVMPHGPPAAKHRFAVEHIQQMVDRLNYTSVSTGQVLGSGHARSPLAQLIRQGELLLQLSFRCRCHFDWCSVEVARISCMARLWTNHLRIGYQFSESQSVVQPRNALSATCPFGSPVAMKQMPSRIVRPGFTNRRPEFVCPSRPAIWPRHDVVFRVENEWYPGARLNTHPAFSFLSVSWSDFRCLLLSPSLKGFLGISARPPPPKPPPPPPGGRSPGHR